ncbi:hypothetical protein [Secundilactobacillus collinoides]|uniref:hypothetical protein n=1 Tax=Secundilactobacillus collinoides TaxID=33960 RepID=UPI000704A3F6|nr:hypothetical protein [Secundilactobacillus collinoides]
MVVIPPKMTDHNKIVNMRRQLAQIVASYHNDYDVLAEILQNAVDSVKLRLEEKRKGINPKY